MGQNDSLIRALVVIVILVLAIPLLLMTVMMPMMGVVGWGPYMDGHMGTGWAWGLAGLVPLLLLLAVGYVAYMALAGSGGGRDPAVDELRRAYARGDLTDEEFEARKERLESDRRE